MKKIIILFSITTLFLNAAELPINPVPAIEAPVHNPRSLFEIAKEKVCGREYEKLETLVQSTKNVEIVDLILVQIRKHLNKDIFFTLFEKIKSKKMAAIFLNRITFNINQQNHNGKTLLYQASFNSQPTSIIRLLIKNGANVNILSHHNFSPLQIASGNFYSNCLENAKLLLQAGAHVNAQDVYGATPLHDASSYTLKKYAPLQLKIVKLLIDNGANINIQDLDGETPLHIASRLGHFNIVELYMNCNPNINIQDNGGNTPLHKISSMFEFNFSNEKLKIAQLLIKHNADPCIVNNAGKLPYKISSNPEVRSYLKREYKRKQEKRKASELEESSPN